MPTTTATDMVRAALIWAASGRGTFPDFNLIDQDEFCNAVGRHRLDGRLLDRLRGAERSVPPRLLAGLNERQRDSADRVRKQMDLYSAARQELRVAHPSSDLIPLKGYELYAHSGHDRHIRRSNDIDVMGYDPDLVVQSFNRLGPTSVHQVQIPDEYANLVVRSAGMPPTGMPVDVHKQFSITNFRPSAEAEAYRIDSASGPREITDRFSTTPLRYSDLIGYLITCDRDGRSLAVLRPEAAVIIRCAHIIKDYLINVSPLPCATVRLDELATVIDLAKLKSFDPGIFNALCSRADAQFVVEFIRKLTVDLMGTDPFSGQMMPWLHSSQEMWFPQNLWWDGLNEGLPANLGWSPGELVIRSPDYDDLTNRLGPFPVKTDQYGHVKMTMLSNNSDDYRRYFFRKGSQRRADIILHLTVRPEALEISASTPAASSDDMSAISVSSGDWRYELFCNPCESRVDFTDYSLTASHGANCEPKCTHDGTRHHLQMTLPWQSLGRDTAPARGEHVPLLFKARRQARGWGKIHWVVVAPIALVI